MIELKSHKLFWKYVNNGWIIRSQPKTDRKKKKAYVHFVFEKEITVFKAESKEVITVDVSERNVTFKVQDKV